MCISIVPFYFIVSIQKWMWHHTWLRFLPIDRSFMKERYIPIGLLVFIPNNDSLWIAGEKWEWKLLRLLHLILHLTISVKRRRLFWYLSQPNETANCLIGLVATLHASWEMLHSLLLFSVNTQKHLSISKTTYASESTRKLYGRDQKCFFLWTWI